MIRCELEANIQDRDFIPSLSNADIMRGSLSGGDSLTLTITFDSCSEGEMVFRNKLADLLESVKGVPNGLVSKLRSTFGCYEEKVIFIRK